MGNALRLDIDSLGPVDLLPPPTHRRPIVPLRFASPSAPLPSSQLAPEQEESLKLRFQRDSQISGLLSRIFPKLTPAVLDSLRTEIKSKEHGKMHDSEMLEDFRQWSCELFSDLAELGVQLLAFPEGKACFADYKEKDFYELYRYLFQHRTEFQHGTLPIQGVTSLSVRPHQSVGEPMWHTRRDHELLDFVQHEVPGYGIGEQSYTPNPHSLMQQLGRYIPPLSVTYHPEPQHSREFLHCLKQEILPGLKHAVAHHTSWMSLNLIGPMIVPDEHPEFIPLLQMMYHTHDRAVSILDDLNGLAEKGLSMDARQSASELTHLMMIIRVKLERFEALGAIV